MSATVNYSVIIPHKNIPQLLERCVASVPARDDVQLIVVDDDSDPAIVDFDRFPGLGRPNTDIIFSKGENGRGAGYARNAGMAAAKGRWLVFADADDMYLPELVEAMDRYRHDAADIIIFDNETAEGDVVRPLSREDMRNHILLEYVRTGDTGLLRYRIWEPWAKFIKRELVERHNLSFSEIAYSNDLFFSIRSGHYAAEIVFDPAKIYRYCRRPSSLTGRENVNRDSHLIRFGEDLRVAEFLNSHGKGSYFGDMVVWRWKKLMRADRAHARTLLPEVKKVAPPKALRKMRMKLWFDPVVMPLRRVFSRKGS